LLPALALTGVTLAAGVWVDPARAAGVIAGAWIVAVFGLHLPRVPVFGAVGQLVFLLIAVASATAIYRNRFRIDLLRSAV
jgi:hypothetical protein